MTASFTTVEQRIAHVHGWLTSAQARRLFAAAAAVRSPGRIVEIGSFQGRSTIVLASAAADGVEVVAIDPHAGNDRGPQEIEGFAREAAGDHDAFNENLRAAGVRPRVRHLRAFSSEALDDVTGEIDLLYVDGAHRFGPAREDLDRWGARVRTGGTMLVHDAFSSVGVTLAILATVLLDPRWRYVGRSGSLVEYRREPVGVAVARVANVCRQLAQLPWFARNLVVKGLIVARLAPLSRLLGHRTGTWPY